MPPTANAALVAMPTGPFIASGGGAHPRYWFPVPPLVAIVAAGLVPLPGRRWAAALVVLAQVGIALLAWGRFAAQRYPDVGWRPGGAGRWACWP